MEKERTERQEAQDGPADGVLEEVQCILTVFGSENMQQSGPHVGRVSASVELGIFSIRDTELGVMLSISLQDAMAVMAKAARRAHKTAPAPDDSTQYADQPVLASAT